MSTTPKKKRSAEAMKRRNQKKKEKARSREDFPERRHLLLTPCLPRPDSYEYDCIAIDCKMVVVEASIPSEKVRIASVGIVDKNGVPVYNVYVPPPGDCRLNKKSRKYCPVNDQQFAIARRCEGTDIESVRRKVLAILHRYNNIAFSRDRCMWLENSIPLQVSYNHWSCHFKWSQVSRNLWIHQLWCYQRCTKTL